MHVISSIFQLNNAKTHQIELSKILWESNTKQKLIPKMNQHHIENGDNNNKNDNERLKKKPVHHHHHHEYDHAIAIY